MIHNPTEVIKLLYSKSKVYIHPSHQQHDFIPGYLTMIDKVNQPRTPHAICSLIKSRRHTIIM
jgi:hypothetical protein